MIKECVNCKENKKHHAKGYCYACYKKVNWKPKLNTCKRCKRKMAIHAKDLCAGCYNYVFHADKNKAYNHRKSKNVDLITYRKVTQKCVLCDFDKIVDLHHIDSNKENNTKENLIGLCPNHHRLSNNYKFRGEIWVELQKLGFTTPLDQKLDFKYHE
ncbi:MAG: hypothetical protein ACI83O_000076 [Patescibacteria group bacterium]|jgi:hypothetical protein